MNDRDTVRDEGLGDKIQGGMDELTGRAKQTIGDVGGDNSTEWGGKVDQAKGEVRQGIGEIKEDWNNDTNR